MSTQFGKMKEMVQCFPQTHFWVDSCAKQDMEYALALGAKGATTNPVIVGQVLRRELPDWEAHIAQLFATMPGASEDDVAWKLIEEMGLRGAKLLEPIFQQNNGTCGKISMQTNIKNYHNSKKMLEQALYFHSLAPNIQVKMPVSEAGLVAFEEATYHGVSVNATVSFTVAQAIQLAEAVERGLNRRKAEGLPTEQITPVCTIMIGRVDDWLKKVVKRDNLAIDPECLEWGGIAVFKKAYEIFQKRGYHTRLLTAAYRNHHHWSALIGGPISMTITKSWLEQFENSSLPVRNTISEPINPDYLRQLSSLPDFMRAYDENGMTPSQFEHYGAFIICLEGFFKGYDELLQLIRPYQFGKPL